MWRANEVVLQNTMQEDFEMFLEENNGKIDGLYLSLAGQ